MTQWHMKSAKKFTGGTSTTRRRCKKKLRWRGGRFTSTTLSTEDERQTVKIRGGHSKVKLKYAQFAIISDPKNPKQKPVKAEIFNTLENPANKQYSRQNIITKGAIIQAKVGGQEMLARVTSRPGQSGIIQAVFIEENALMESTRAKKAKTTASKAKEKAKEAQKSAAIEPKIEEKKPNAGEKPKTTAKKTGK